MTKTKRYEVGQEVVTADGLFGVIVNSNRVTYDVQTVYSLKRLKAKDLTDIKTAMAAVAKTPICRPPY